MYKKELKVAQQAIEKARSILLKFYKKEFEVSRKGTDSGIVDIVTTADLESQKAIINILEREFPDYGILAEESSEIERSDKKWIIDPLDGTMNFSRGNPMFGICIALEEKGRVVLGLIDFPVLKETFYAVKGKGAFINGKKTNVSKKSDKSSSIFFGGMRVVKYNKTAEGAFINLNKKFPSNFRVVGCAAYNLSSIASGRAEGLVSCDTKPWDIAAGGLIVEESGGKATDFSGSKWNPYQKNYVVSNGVIHKEIMSCINSNK